MVTNEELKTNVQQGLKTLANELDRRVGGIKRQVKEIRLSVHDSPEIRQMLGIGVAFVIGMAVGVAISRDRK
jgi:ElaB/YqjD/DUF883 family membrane-anchored ribosome-binding protein